MVKILKRKNSRGVTLIELIITMALSSIILTLMLSVFFTGSKLYKYISDTTEIQQQGHFIMDFITTKAMPASSVTSVIDSNNVSRNSSSEKIEVKEIELEDEMLEKEEKHIFSIQKDDKVEGKSIRYGKSKTAKVELGNYIKKMYVYPLPKESNFESAKGLEFSIELQKGEANIEVIKQMYFRK